LHAAVAFIAGICATVAALLLLAALQGITYYGASPQLQTTLAIVIAALGALAVWMLYKGVRANLSRVVTGKEALIGARGVAVTDLKPKGEIRVVGEFWRATAKAGWIREGEGVEVVGLEGFFLVVRPYKEKA
jgi:membrane-bound serine protease (ClpP class)